MKSLKVVDEPLLSFAIPTYNFGRFIGDTIKSIVNGAEELSLSQFEIVVLDGGSNDETEPVVATLIEQYPNIRYLRNPERGGIDRDMDTVVELTKGQYIWLFSADDFLVPGWDKHIAPLLIKGGDVFLVPAILCDIKMRPLRPNPIFRDCIGTEPVQFDLLPDNDSLDNYLGRLATLEAMFSFMSAILVHEKAWRELSSREDYFGSCWAHCARLIPLLFRSSKITYVNRFLINKRGGNDSFLENGIVARLGIAVEGWGRIIDEFFIKTDHKHVLLNALRRDASIILFIYAKLSSQSVAEVNRIRCMAQFLYSDPDLPLTVRLCYRIFCLVPASPTFMRIMVPVLPLMKRLRHKIKSV